MKTLIFGAGAVGGYFGGRMAAAGLDVGFVVREARAKNLADKGLKLVTPDGEERVTDLAVHTAGAPLPKADILLMAIKATGLNDAIHSLKDNVSGGTLIIPLLNGLRHIHALDAAFGDKAVAGGLCYIQASTDEYGVIRRHNQIQKLVAGPRSKAQAATVKEFVSHAAPAGFDVEYSPNIEQAMWNKITFLATPFLKAAHTAVLVHEGGIGS